jgi:hypothetical protein
MKATRHTSKYVTCQVPQYSQPDVLPVEITLNGADYTNNGFTYGFYDPFLIKVNPKLLSVQGTTIITLEGFGFVNTTGTSLKVKFDDSKSKLECAGNDCTKMATFINKNAVTSAIYPMNTVKYKESSETVKYTPFEVEVSVYGDVYTKNKLTIHYFEQPLYNKAQPSGGPANHETPILIDTDFRFKNGINNRFDFDKYGNFTCRFKSLDGKKIIYTKGQMIVYPLSNEADAVPNYVSCLSPGEWQIDGDKEFENVKLDISVNGQDFSGDIDYKISELLELYRIQPLAGPNEGGTQIRLIGTGFAAEEDLYAKWGIVSTSILRKSTLTSYLYSNDRLKSDPVAATTIYNEKSENIGLPVINKAITNGKTYKMLVSRTPKLSNWYRTYGGPVYVELGKNTELNTTYQTEPVIMYSYISSYVEFYYYKQPVVKEVFPHGGQREGGTNVLVAGAWFDYQPQYGVIPHCKFGDIIVRGTYLSTVRIVCQSPPSDQSNIQVPIYVSLNAQDFTDTGFMFNYYDRPVVTRIEPDSGSEAGGTQIRLFGNQFSNKSDSAEFLCKFTSKEMNIPPKTIPAVYENSTSIFCLSPGGWGSGTEASVEVTFNGQDYTSDDHSFWFYNIGQALPRSGPADGSGGYIEISGSGFRNTADVLCKIDDSEYTPADIKWDLIRCKMPPAKAGPKFFGNVNFALSMNGNSWHEFVGGFQYYEQPSVEDIYPKFGPNQGKGVVNFYGKNFRGDFDLSDLACKIGDSVGLAQVISDSQMKCIVKDLPLVGPN